MNHVWLEFATIAGIASAAILAWGAIALRMGRNYMDQLCTETIRTEVSAVIAERVAPRQDRLEKKLDQLIDLHLWDGNTERRVHE
jgi:hypothetical protein